MQIRKTASAALGALMAGATIAAPALAVGPYDLTDFPAPFVSGGSADFVAVVGNDAQSSDTLAVADITARLGGDVVAPSSGSTSTADTDREDVNLNDTLTTDFGTSLDDADLDFLFDGTISFDGKTWNTHEEITIGSGVTVETSLSNSGVDDYSDEVYIEVARGSLGYYYVFDEAINLSARVDSSDNLVIDFLGKTLTITAIGDADTITAEVGEKITLDAGESATVAGKTVSLVKTGASNALISVDGVEEAIDSGDTETVSGIRVKVDSVFNDDGVEFDSAILIVGTEAEESIDDGDEYIGEDEDDPRWVWDLGSLLADAKGDTTPGSGGPTIGVINDFVLTDEDGDESADVPALTVGGSLAFPNDFVSLNFESLTGSSDPLKVEVEFDDSIDADDVAWLGSSESGFVIKAGADETIVLDTAAGAATPTDTVYLIVNDTTVGDIDVVYLDSDNNQVSYETMSVGDAFLNLGYIDFGDTTGTSAPGVELEVVGNVSVSGAFRLVFHEHSSVTSERLNLTLGDDGTDFDALGATGNTEEASELSYAGTNIGTKDEDHRTTYGIRIENPENNGASDKVILWIPSDEMEATLSFSGAGGAAVSQATSGQITSSVTRLDTEVSSPASAGNLILVGGPCVHDLVEQLAASGDYPYTCADFPDGAYVNLVNDAFADGQTALVVAGLTAGQTRSAAAVVQNYGSAGWSGTSHIA